MRIIKSIFAIIQLILLVVLSPVIVLSLMVVMLTYRAAYGRECLARIVKALQTPE